MPKTILITGATDGIGLETAKMLVSLGHTLLLHGRNWAKLEAVETALAALLGAGRIETYVADLSRLAEVEVLARAVAETHETLDVLINNAGVYAARRDAVTADGLDVRFAVNTIAPYLLTQILLPRMPASARVVNVTSAAQAPVDRSALAGERRLSEGTAYAQSKLALIMWSRALAASREGTGPVIIAVNPGSLLPTKMVKQVYGSTRGHVGIGAEILTRAALADDFADASGEYFDNDEGQFAPPHADALDPAKVEDITDVIDTVLARQPSASDA